MSITSYNFDLMLDHVETAELVTFTRIVETNSFSRAATELGTPRATVGRRMARLEERLGVRLLRRTTRAVALTDAGEAFYRHARIAIDAVAQAEASVRMSDSIIRGALRIATPPMLDSSFNALVCDFAKAHPEVRIQVNASSEYADLLRDGYDLAIRASTELEPGLVARTLARTSAVAVASPAYLAEFGTPKHARDLRSHRCLVGMREGRPHSHWPKAGGGRLSVEGFFVSSDITLLMDAAVRGLGIAVMPILLAGVLLERGTLVHVLPKVIHAESRVAVVYSQRELLPPQVRAFLDVLARWCPTETDAARFAGRRWPSNTVAPAAAAPRRAKTSHR